MDDTDQKAIDEATSAARAAFEDFATMDAPDLPGDEVNAMQVRLMRWQRDRFGLQGDKIDLRMAHGVIEEMGEAFEADTAEKAFDGLGDVIVYAGQLAIANRLAIAPIIDLAARFVARGAVVGLLAASRFSHLVLKADQKIRGLDDVNAYRRGLVEHLAECIANAWETVQLCHAREPVAAAKVYLIVGAEVLERKRGDAMIPKAETVGDLDAAAADPIDHKAAALAALVKANNDLGVAEIEEGPGDFVVGCRGVGHAPNTLETLPVQIACPECGQTFTNAEIAIKGLGLVPLHPALPAAARAFDMGGES